MSDSLFRTTAGYYFLMRATLPQPENVVLTVLRITELDWAEALPLLTALPEPEFGWESVTEGEPYLRLDVWPKYCFPRFGGEPVGEGHAYQWYGLEDAAELQEVLVACVQQAAAHGVVLGSR